MATLVLGGCAQKRVKTDISTLSYVKAKGVVSCGVSTGLQDFSIVDNQARWRGLDVDFCRAVAIALFNDVEKVNFVPLSAKERFMALQSGEVDLLARNTSWSMTRDTAIGLDFVGPNFIDGQAVMVNRDLGITDARQLHGLSVCLVTNSTMEVKLAEYFIRFDMQYRGVGFQDPRAAIRGLEAGKCDYITMDGTGLVYQARSMKEPHQFKILPQRLSLEPMSPVVLHGDDQWRNLVRTVFDGLILAEEYSINRNNASSEADAEILIASQDIGVALGLSREWLLNVISKLGNYGELYKRNFTMHDLNTPRLLNNQPQDGGLLFPHRFVGLNIPMPPNASVVNPPTIKEIVRRGHVRCGIVTGPARVLSAHFLSDHDRRAFDQETCGVVSAALFGRSDAVDVTNGDLGRLLQAVANGDIDMIATPITRDAMLAANGYDQPVISLIDKSGTTWMPKGPVLAGDNNALSDLVRWSVLARTLYDEYDGHDVIGGLVESRAPYMGGALGISKHWYKDVQDTVGSLEQSLRVKAGENGVLHRANMSWVKGGFQYAPPLR